MAENLAVKYAKELDQKFTQASQTIRHMRNIGEFKEDNGVASVFFRTVDTSDFLQGHTKSQFGDMSDVKSDVVRKDVELFYEINKNLTAVQIDDTAGAMKEAGHIMDVAVEEAYAPLIDKLSIGVAIKAATGYGGEHVVTYDPANPLVALGKARAALKNQRSTSKFQTLFIAASAETDFDKDMFKIYAPNTNDDTLSKGEIMKLLGIEVEILPDDIFNTFVLTGTAPYAQAKFSAKPEVKAVLWDNRVMGYVNKLKELTVLTGDLARAAGSDGAVLRSLLRPGAWVFDANGTKKGIAILQTA